MGFKGADSSSLCSSIEAVVDFWARFAAERGSLDFEIDGVVVKVDSVEQQRRLGSTA